MQKITLIGRLGDDPTERMTPNNHKMTTFSLAVSVKKDSVCWYKINIWADRIPMFAGMLSYLKKGSGVCVMGDLGIPYTYINKKGEPATSLSVTPFSISWVGSTGEKKKEDTEFPSALKEPVDTSQNMSKKFSSEFDPPF